MMLSLVRSPARPAPRTLVACLAISAALAAPGGFAIAADPGPTATLVQDIHPSGGSQPQQLTRVGDRVFFTARDGVHGTELWVTDGTSDGTRLVRDIRPGATSSQPQQLTRVGDRLFFSARDATHGRELWVSDGTRRGTRMVRDLTLGPKGSDVNAIMPLHGTTFVALDQRGLWRTEGTSATTRRVGSVTQVGQAGPLGGMSTWAVKGRILYFFADDRTWRTDGTDVGTRWISPKQTFLSDLTVVNARLLFYGNTPTAWCCGERYLWLSDGTRAGTKRAKSLLVRGGEITRLGRVGVFSAAIPDRAPRMFRTDGTQAGTGPVLPRTRPPIEAGAAGGALWFSTGGSDETDDTLWTSDGSNAGTNAVFGGAGDWHLPQGAGGRFVAFDGGVWFAAGAGDPWAFMDHELWVTDGTEAGTREAIDLAPAGSSSPDDLVPMDGVLYLTADDGAHGRELWRIDA